MLHHQFGDIDDDIFVGGLSRPTLVDFDTLLRLLRLFSVVTFEIGSRQSGFLSSADAEHEGRKHVNCNASLYSV